MLVRVNAAGTRWHAADVAALAGFPDLVLMLPMAERPRGRRGAGPAPGGRAVRDRPRRAGRAADRRRGQLHRPDVGQRGPARRPRRTSRPNAVRRLPAAAGGGAHRRPLRRAGRGRHAGRHRAGRHRRSRHAGRGQLRRSRVRLRRESVHPPPAGRGGAQRVPAHGRRRSTGLARCWPRPSSGPGCSGSAAAWSTPRCSRTRGRCCAKPTEPPPQPHAGGAWRHAETLFVNQGHQASS